MSSVIIGLATPNCARVPVGKIQVSIFLLAGRHEDAASAAWAIEKLRTFVTAYVRRNATSALRVCKRGKRSESLWDNRADDVRRRSHAEQALGAEQLS